MEGLQKIVNYTASNSPILKQNDGFLASHAWILSTKIQIYSYNIQEMSMISIITKQCIGSFHTIANFLAVNGPHETQKSSFNDRHIEILSSEA